MWSARSTQIDSDQAVKVEIDLKQSPISYAQVLSRWQDDVNFRSFFIDLLATSSYSSFRWETPPITVETADRPFEFVLLDSPGLARSSDVQAFAEYFNAASPRGVIEFPNLGKDGIMVVPCPGEPLSAYAHLGTYARHAAEAQQHALWQLVGAAMQRRLSAKPVWLSTAGAGVAWLHIRLDDRPKYYRYAPYQRPPASIANF